MTKRKKPHAVAQLTAREAAELVRMGYGISLGPIGPLTTGVNDKGEQYWTFKMEALIITDPVTGYSARLIG